MKKLSFHATEERLRARLEKLYPKHVDQSLRRLNMIIERYGVGIDPQIPKERWSEKDAVLITYGDTILSENQAPLEALRRFASRHLLGAFSTIHILPFYPFSSDDGFSVIDFRAVNSPLGDWKNIHALKDQFDLMFDWVLNHVSSQSAWFRDYLNCIQPYRDYFIEGDPETDLSDVTRPRTSPLLTEVQTKAGLRHVWTTFSADQVDLNWENPDVFFEMLDVLLGYISQGARIVRLDAVAFLWKKMGTTCLHLDETHEVIRLIRDILEIAAPSVIILTETNVPHEENISYFGEGDEAHMVYQFTLPPLLLHGLLNETATALTAWAKALPDPPENCTFFNFTASHDGIGLRPLEGILPREEIDALAEKVKERGGLLSYRNQPDGSKSVYEMNITYYSALSDPTATDSTLGEARFRCSQLLAASLKGIPGIYLHSLTATENHIEGYKESGMPRRVNRRKWNEEEIDRLLQDPQTHHSRVFFDLIKVLRRRARCDAFHPDGTQEVLELDDRIFAILRRGTKANSQVLCLNNFTASEADVSVTHLIPTETAYEIVSDSEWERPTDPITLAPYQTVWLYSRIL